MKQSKYQQIRVIESKDPTEFQTEFNKAQQELADQKPETIYDISDGYRAIIQYEVNVSVAESARDELALEGIYPTCGDCPKFQPVLNNDGSVKQTSKKGSCDVEAWTCRDSVACDWFCRKVMREGLK